MICRSLCVIRPCMIFHLTGPWAAIATHSWFVRDLDYTTIQYNKTQFNTNTAPSCFRHRHPSTDRPCQPSTVSVFRLRGGYHGGGGGPVVCRVTRRVAALSPVTGSPLSSPLCPQVPAPGSLGTRSEAGRRAPPDRPARPAARHAAGSSVPDHLGTSRTSVTHRGNAYIFRQQTPGKGIS